MKIFNPKCCKYDKLLIISCTAVMLKISYNKVAVRNVIIGLISGITQFVGHLISPVWIMLCRHLEEGSFYLKKVNSLLIYSFYEGRVKYISENFAIIFTIQSISTHP